MDDFPDSAGPSMSHHYTSSADGSKRQRTDASPNCTIYIPNPGLIGAQVGLFLSSICYLGADRIDSSHAGTNQWCMSLPTHLLVVLNRLCIGMTCGESKSTQTHCFHRPVVQLAFLRVVVITRMLATSGQVCVQ